MFAWMKFELPWNRAIRIHREREEALEALLRAIQKEGAAIREARRAELRAQKARDKEAED